jgi:hypothetical protein
MVEVLFLLSLFVLALLTLMAVGGIAYGMALL